MFNGLKNNWLIICNTFHEDKVGLLLAVLATLACFALMVLTFKAVSKFDFLVPFFFILIAILLFNFYVNVVIWIINLIK